MRDLDPNYALPLWQSLVSYFRRYRPLVQADHTLPMPPRSKCSAGAGPHRPLKERT
jgi:hypothetical protein